MAGGGKRHRRGILAAVAAAAALVAAGAWLFPRGGGEAAQALEETAPVKRGPLTISIETNGQIQARNSVGISLKSSRGWGNVRITWLIEDGSEVKKDDILAKCENEWLKDQVSNYEMRLEDERARLTDRQEAKKIKEAELAARVTAAKFALEKAEMDMDLYGEVILDDDGRLNEAVYGGGEAPAKGEAYQRFRDAELAITKAASDLERGEADFAGMDLLLEKGFVTQNNYEDAALAVTEARRAVESARLSHDILTRYTYPQELASKRNAYEKARDGLQRTEIEAKSELLREQAELRTAELSFKNSNDRHEELKKEFENLEIKAPQDGAVLYGDPSYPWSRHQVRVGGYIWPGLRLFTMPDTSEMVVQTRVLEMDVYKAKAGQQVLITVEALPGVTLKGKISRIAESTRTRRWWQGEKWNYFGVDVKLDEQDERLKPGMSCDVEIIVDRLQEALYVPVGAVFDKGGKRFCYVVSDGGRELVEVRVGQSSEKHVEILEGLSEGQNVLLGEKAPAAPKQEGAGAAGRGKVGAG